MRAFASATSERATGGKVIAGPSGIGKKGHPTFDGLIVNAKWAAKNEAFVVALVKALANTAVFLQEQLPAAYSVGATRWQVVRHVVLPAALPDILVGMRIAVGFGWTTLVAASVGLGRWVLNASNFLRTDIVVMGIVVIGVVAYAFDLLMRHVERVLVPWKGRG